jgi:hypothetical protein
LFRPHKASIKSRATATKTVAPNKPLRKLPAQNPVFVASAFEVFCVGSSRVPIVRHQHVGQFSESVGGHRQDKRSTHAVQAAQNGFADGPNGFSPTEYFLELACASSSSRRSRGALSYGRQWLSPSLWVRCAASRTWSSSPRRTLHRHSPFLHQASATASKLVRRDGALRVASSGHKNRLRAGNLP